MNRIHHLCSIILLILLSGFYIVSAHATSAIPTPVQYTQPDGTILTLLLHGDEFIHYASTPDGFTLLSGKDGYYEYAQSDREGNIVFSGIRAHNADERNLEEKRFLRKTKKGLFFSKAQVEEMKSWLKSGTQRAPAMSLSKGFPKTGNRKLLQILANFSNTTTTYTQSDFQNLMNQPGYNGIGSFRDYFLEVSYGQLTVVTIVTAWVNLPSAHDYYGDPSKNGEFAFDAIVAADQQAGINFGEYDSNFDGVVDGVSIIHQGRGEEESADPNDIWSHSWDLVSAGYSVAQRTFDGVQVIDYTTMPEKNGPINMTTIGVICHEFCHNLGSPDFYDTDYALNGQYDGTGNWDLMGSGSWNGVSGSIPAHPNGWIKSCFGWSSPVILNSPQAVLLRNAQVWPDAARYYTTTPGEYFLCENRQQTGFDSALPGHGMIIYHVDSAFIASYTNSNKINIGSHQGMFPMSAISTTANGIMPSSSSNINTGGCPWPGTGNKAAFNDVTMPRSKSWIGANTNQPLTSITENTSTKDISFCFISCVVNNPVSFTANAVNSGQIDLDWLKNNAGEPVMIAWGTTPVFGTPVSGSHYSIGNLIPGGGTVLYNGPNTSCNHSGIMPNSTYFYKAWSVSDITNYSTGVTATATTPYPGIQCPGIPVVSHGGKNYHTVQIGNQCWLKENLNIGTKISGSEEQTNNAVIEKYCYNDLESNCDVYGGLYQWDEMMNYTASGNANPSGRQGICPAGWHLPSDAEWCELEVFLDATVMCAATGWSGLSIGGQLKESGTEHWLSPNLGATNSSGFTTLGAGYRNNTGSFSLLSEEARYWSSAGFSSTDAFDRIMACSSASVSRSTDSKKDGFSARCILDCSNPSFPGQGIHTPALDQIIWNWNSVPGAVGYRWNTSNDYASATDVGSMATKTETGLDCSTSYTRYVWAYNACGHSGPVELNQATSGCPPFSCGQPVTDSRDNKIYNTVQIASQCWFKENLNLGTRINGSLDQADNGIIEKYCYNDLEAYCNIYGGLYQWNEMMAYTTAESGQGICPSGWHVPSEGEWALLTVNLASYVYAGGLMKESGTSHWLSPNTGATNSSGFTSLPAGYRSGNASFEQLSLLARLWSSSSFNPGYVLTVRNNYDNMVLFPQDSFTKNFGFSFRCLKNCDMPLPPVPGTNSVSNSQITWQWGSIAGASGYKWNIVNDYYSATDVSVATSTAEPGLICNTDYTRYVWSYNPCGISGSTMLNQTTAPCPDFSCGQNVNDARDGRSYSTVPIGNQCWFGTNLNIGIRINGSQPQANNGAIEKYCYDDLESGCDLYGGLYQWDEIMQYTTTPGAQGICPAGSHLPTHNEFNTLFQFLGGNGFVGGKLKETGTLHWLPPNAGATNSTGFTSLPGGSWTIPGMFSWLGTSASYWTSTQVPLNSAFFWYLVFDQPGFGYNDNVVSQGFSVRCLMDCQPPLSPIPGSHVALPNQIKWYWNSVTGAIGYKWNTINDYASAVDMGSGISKTETGLECNTSYSRYVWAYTLCGYSEVCVLTQSTASCWLCGQPATDPRDEKTYNTVLIGTQCWFAQNLNIGIKIDSNIFQANNGILEKYCYHNLESSCDEYGGLYQWDEMMDYSPASDANPSGRMGICPDEWHIPSSQEFSQMASVLGDINFAGGKLKETGFLHWNSPNSGANNTSGFTALGAGGVYPGTLCFNLQKILTDIWSSSTHFNGLSKYVLHLNNSMSGLYIQNNDRPNGLSVRCVKDNCPSYINSIISITASANGICSGTSVTFTATPVNGGAAPSFRWKVNGQEAGTDNPVFTYIPANNDHVVCLLTSNASCQPGIPVPSNAIVMTVNPSQPVVVTVTPSANPVCAGTSVSFTAMPVNGGTQPGFQWKLNGGDIGTNSNSLSLTPVNGDVVTCVLTSNDICATGNPASSTPTTMAVNQTLPVIVSISESANPVCEGTSVIVTATPVNGGSLPSYQWTLNGNIVGSNIAAHSLVPSNGDIVTCTLTSNYQCASGNPATALPITMTVNPNLPVSVSIVGPSNPVCPGDLATFTAIPVNGGLAPAYQWKVNGSNAGSNISLFTYTPANSDKVECVVSSSETCTTGNPASSNSITVVVSTILPVGLSIAASANPFCPGSQITFTAIPVNGGTAPGYQWKVNSTNAGINNVVFTYNPSAGDLVSCVMTSNLSCITGNPVTSNAIFMLGAMNPIVTFSPCFDGVTSQGSVPFKLKGGLPLGGTYSGPGVNPVTGMFTPSSAGPGLKNIVYTYTNHANCEAFQPASILVLSDVPFSCGNLFSDPRDNRPYPTFSLPNGKCWMAANLNFGTFIPGNLVQSDDCLPQKYCLQDIAANCNVYGGFYQWDELMQYENAERIQGLCPPGWHIPDSAEWNELIGYCEGNPVAGNILKDSLKINGFHGLPAGLFYLNNTWWAKNPPNLGAMYWTSTSVGSTQAFARGIHMGTPSVSRYNSGRANSFHTRCVKN